MRVILVISISRPRKTNSGTASRMIVAHALVHAADQDEQVSNGCKGARNR